MIEKNFDVKELKLAQKEIKNIRDTIPKAYYSAIQRTGQMVKTRSSRLVREKYYVKSAEVKDRIKLRRGSVKNPFAEIRAKGNNIPIIKFRATPKQVTPRRPKVQKVGVKKAGNKPLKGAFIAKVGGGGHVGVFKRAGRRRLPIEEVYGPAVPVMMNEPRIIKDLEEFASEKFKDRLDHEIKRRLDKVEVNP